MSCMGSVVVQPVMPARSVSIIKVNIVFISFPAQNVGGHDAELVRLSCTPWFCLSILPESVNLCQFVSGVWTPSDTEDLQTGLIAATNSSHVKCHDAEPAH